MAHLELAAFDEGGDLGSELQQAQQVRHGRARATHRVRRLLMRDAELADEALERARFFQRVEIFALDVFDERHRDGGFIGHAANDGRNGGEAGDLRGTPAAFAGDDFVALRFAGRGAIDGAHHDGLDDALRLDGCRQFFERFLAHVDARLVLASLQQVERQVGEFVTGQLRRRWRRSRTRVGRGLRTLGHLAEQCLESTPHHRFLRAHGAG